MTNVLLIGFAHEEQHQELFLTDIKHVFSCTMFPEPVYKSRSSKTDFGFVSKLPDPDWVEFKGGVARFGHGQSGFAFDNEGPEHEAILTPFALATRPVSNAEYLAFIEADGYQRPEFWLSEGWAAIQAEQRYCPFHWRETETGWREHTLHGLEAIDPNAPVSHIDYYEASAFAHWSGYRLPEEREWEFAARSYAPSRGRWATPGERLHPVLAENDGPIEGLFGEVWEWTRSAYAPYPGYCADAGAIGEYNGKFMCAQFVLRGGSCLTPSNHIRPTYRNFFPANAQWQMTGVRMAKDI
jgi:ergothioneine biosynthesis protein EgtB